MSLSSIHLATLVSTELDSVRGLVLDSTFFFVAGEFGLDEEEPAVVCFCCA
jgi:hypothetical protein